MRKFNFQKLKGRIVEKFDTLTAFAKALGMSDQNLSGKLKNKIRFSHIEIFDSIKLLDIPNNEIYSYFFTLQDWEISKRNVKFGIV